MSMSAHPALVLNADFRPMSYFPLSLLSWQDAISAVFSQRVSVVAEYDASARSPSTRIRLPSVVALRKYQRPPRRVAFTRFNVFLRDRFTCQYCGGQAFAASALTFEHVVPRSHGGQTTWSNIVTACVPCNTGKGNSLRIKPRRLPKEPTVKELMAARRAFPPGYLHESWVDYLYWDAQLES
jgi:5-methylcytosine-specific restriction endonuclease McrA